MQDPARLSYLKALGITSWIPRQTDNRTVSDCVIYQQSDSPTIEKHWQQLQRQVAACTACSLSQTRTQTVFGVGNHHADLLCVGEAPGYHEDKQGEPFVGRAGQLLDAMLRSIQLDRSKIYIANILKCRPPNNRDPSPEEVKLCTPFLTQQIALIKPKLIVALGRIAAHFLLKSDTPLSRLRNQVFQYGEYQTPLIITYHPAYLLRSPKEKAKAMIDWITITKYLQRTVTT